MVIALFYKYFLFLNLFYVDVIVRKNEGTLILNLLTSSALLLTLTFAVISESAEKKARRSLLKIVLNVTNEMAKASSTFILLSQGMS